MNVLKIAAFSDGETGGNPAGVVIGDALPAAVPGSSIRVSGTARIMRD